MLEVERMEQGTGAGSKICSLFHLFHPQNRPAHFPPPNFHPYALSGDVK